MKQYFCSQEDLQKLVAFRQQLTLNKVNALCIQRCKDQQEECLRNCQRLFQYTYAPFVYQMSETYGYQKTVF